MHHLCSQEVSKFIVGRTCGVSVVSGFLEEVSFNESVCTGSVEFVQTGVCLGQHVLELVGILEHLSLNHAIRLHVVNLAIILFVVLRLE